MMSCWPQKASVLGQCAAQSEAARTTISTSKSEVIVLYQKRVPCPRWVVGEINSVRWAGGLVQPLQLCGWYTVPLKGKALDLSASLRTRSHLLSWSLGDADSTCLERGWEAQPLRRSWEESHCTFALRGVSWGGLNTSLGRYCRHAWPGGDPPHAGEMHACEGNLGISA